ncbi:MAG: hypothetical protein E6G65_04825 [Actinobacteria bacterium]|nr:MAG: hypothetical protein E6G65_04825 [Actinomycetota bacterium]
MGVGSMLGDGLGDGDRLGRGEGVGVGLADGDAVGEGDGYTVRLGPTVFPANEGTVNATAGLPCIATDMKSCQIAAGIVPPYTDETPSTSCSEISPAGHPIHTHVAICIV